MPTAVLTPTTTRVLSKNRVYLSSDARLDVEDILGIRAPQAQEARRIAASMLQALPKGDTLTLEIRG